MPHDSDCDSRVSVSKANRKIAKPIMEKKRRARINASLNELKTLLVEVLQKEGCRHSSKMEKADILEMAVRHLKNLQKQQAYSGTTTHTLRDSYPPAIPLEKFAANLPADCLTPEMAEYLNKNSTDVKLKPNSGSPDSSTTCKRDNNKNVRNILPAPQPINLSSLPSAMHHPMMTRTANGEVAVVLPQHILQQVGTSSNGLILPVYPQAGDDHLQRPMTISINMPLHQSPNSAFSQTSSSSSAASVSSSVSSPSPVSYMPTPTSPVWRPW